ncbi:hypothetical protein HB852_10830 [Listeria grandensis]|uniref:hypothetical protein n=1 Tax=Listeria grandensis TaxID=1494963 RepID=UPI00162A5744|nr:hypothetical protein [Listeria grandensis]MBC1475113.1 hypothetical protein [Listeria grandensis]
MTKVWTEFSKCKSNPMLNYMAIMGIEMEIAPYKYKEYCVEMLDATLPMENINYFVLIFEEVEFPTRIDYYKKVWGMNKERLDLIDCERSQEYVVEIEGVTFFYGILRIDSKIPHNLAEVISEFSDGIVFGDVLRLSELDITSIFLKEKSKLDNTDIIKQSDYPVYFQFLNAGCEAGLYVFVTSDFSSSMEENDKIDTERLKKELKGITDKKWKVNKTSLSIYDITDDSFGLIGDGVLIPDYFWLIGHTRVGKIWIDLSSAKNSVYEQIDANSDELQLLYDRVKDFIKACNGSI